MTTSKCENTGT